ncbi:helix-turn-helix domain-containing protein [Mesorhizobium sp. 8]|uniref:helix-turn-helix transcriptional regulator n=1 Tax=Mesorhizobium sp. 8 TaxID=2584466 RepID=UPI00112309E8|nr:helix-turn-helix domain-containing protein [Mesorhizobium sp. 8]QDB99738.1 helix-turn-helix domain-containing protein [Mesorhizobium sp. 8]
MAANIIDLAAVAGCEPLLTTKQAAALLGYAPQTLANMRAAGRGPAFIKLGNGATRYKPSAIRDWAGGATTVHEAA